MKAEISIPDAVFEAARQTAEELNMSLSEFYAAALTAYVAASRNGDITKRLDEVYAKADSTLEPNLVSLQVTSLGDERW